MEASMTKLGAKKNREKNIWTYDGHDREEGEVICFTGSSGMMATGGGGKTVDDREYGEEEVKIACEWTLVFMLLFGNRNSSRWAIECMELAFEYPHGSYRHIFWWSARTLCNERGHSPFTLEEFREYMASKTLDFEPTGWIKKDGPQW
jgi:hypothetical protein